MLCVMFFSANTLAFAEDVYITQNGSKYHKKECRFIKNRETQAIDKDKVIEQGYLPCGRCFKEDLSLQENKSAEKTVTVKKKKKQNKS